jgi:hypothetical protein
MSPVGWERQALNSIQSVLGHTDPKLASHLAGFSRLASSEELPAHERVRSPLRHPPYRHRSRRRRGKAPYRGRGLQAAETVIRSGMLKLGCGVLGELPSADRGHRGPAVPCGNGHEAVCVSYRDKVIDTVLGPVTLNRAWYHCTTCKHGLAPRDAELGVAGTSLSPGLTAMNDKAAAAGPMTTRGCFPARASAARSAAGLMVIRTVSSLRPSSVIRTITLRRRCRSIPTTCRPSYASVIVGLPCLVETDALHLPASARSGGPLLIASLLLRATGHIGAITGGSARWNPAWARRGTSKYSAGRVLLG